MFAPYAKAIAAFVGLLAIVSKDVFGFEIDGSTVDAVVNGILAVGTVLAVLLVRNGE
jgi:hypothetical protein